MDDGAQGQHRAERHQPDGGRQRPGRFTVAIIPYTWEHTNLHRTPVGAPMNLEFDVMGKYVARLLDAQLNARGVGGA